MIALTRRDVVALVLLTALAALLRFYRLDASLWYDEVLTLLDYVRLRPSEIVTTYTSLNNHILFTLQSWMSVAAFGESAWAVRLPAAVFGVATVPLLWLIVRRIGLPSLHADLSALLLALNYHHIWFSQNARGYTGLVFWCLLALFFLIGARRCGLVSAWLGLALSGALAMYTHLSAAFFLFALFLAGLAAEIGPRQAPGRAARLRGLIGGFGFMAVVVLLLYAPIIDDILATMTSVATDAAEASVNPLEKWENPASALIGALDDLPGPLAAALIAGPLALIVLAAGWVRVLRHDAVTAWVVPLSIIVTVGLLLAAGMRIWPRYFLVDVVLFLVLAVAGVAAVADALARGRAARVLAWTGWGLGVALSAVWGVQNYKYPKQDFAGAIAYAESQAETGDRFATFGLSALPVVRYYRSGWAVLDDPAALDAALAEPGALWIVIGFDDHSRARYPQVFGRLERDFERAAKLPGTLGGGTVYVYRSRPGAGEMPAGGNG